MSKQPTQEFGQADQHDALLGLDPLMQEDTDPFPPPIHIGSRSVWTEKEVVA